MIGFQYLQYAARHPNLLVILGSRALAATRSIEPTRNEAYIKFQRFVSHKVYIGHSCFINAITAIRCLQRH